jgi:hypothetical protein
MRLMFIFAAALVALPVPAAETTFSFGDFPLDQTPPGFRSIVAGRGKPGDWKIVMDEVPPLLAPLTAKAPTVASRAVLAQKAREPLAVHFPILVFDEEAFGDFKFTTRFKLDGGALEQAAGMVFRFQNESNFFIVLASGLTKNLRCTKMVNGVMMSPLPVNPPTLEIGKDTWHELSVQCEGTRITGTLDGTEAIKLVDNSSASTAGKIGFCTRSDATSSFVDAKVTFTAREILAQKLVKDALKEYSRLVGLEIYAVRPGGKGPVVVASKDGKDLGKAGSATEQDVIKTGHSYYGKDKGTVTVVLPLRDHNGDAMAAVSLVMKSFKGQTQDNALVRAQPIIRKLQAQVQSLDDLLQ